MLKMYYKSVNRGLAFTKPGLYTVGYILAIGLLAIITGINGFYLFLSTGLALLIISGIISERVMRHNKVVYLEKIQADANTPFDLTFCIHNDSKTFTTYGIETSFTLEKPKARFLKNENVAPITGTALKIAPCQTADFVARCGGLPRGSYHSIYSTQRTIYPFGLLEKFKITNLKCDITIVPGTDMELLAALTNLVTRQQAKTNAEIEFFSHSAYMHKDPIKYVDWKRSAGKSPKDWVVKQYRSEIETVHFRILSLWDYAVRSQTEYSYESILSRIRTAVRALSTETAQVGLDTGSGAIIWGAEHILLALAGAPKFDKRIKGLTHEASDATPVGQCITVEITPTNHGWYTGSKATGAG